MQSENFYRKITCEFINNSGSEIEVVRKLDLVKNVLRSESEIYNQLSQLKPRFKRMINTSQKGTLDNESFEVNMNKIYNATNQILRTIELKDIAIDFDFDERDELIYHFTNSQKETIYKFQGNLFDNQPHGKGIAKYPNGNIFKGNFKKGNRDGYGTLYNKNNEILHEGNWSNNKFIDKNSVKYFPNIKAAANSIVNPESIQEMEFELMKIPQLKGENMFAFPIEGDSMEPNFLKNDIVVCKEIFDSWEIKDGDVYIIYHKNKLVVKRVKKITTEEGKPKKYSLISDNYTNHYPYEITPNLKTKFYNLLMQLKSH